LLDSNAGEFINITKLFNIKDKKIMVCDISKYFDDHLRESKLNYLKVNVTVHMYLEDVSVVKFEFTDRFAKTGYDEIADV
jgi:hypothetical protein